MLAGEADPEEAARQLMRGIEQLAPGVPGRREPRPSRRRRPPRSAERRFYQAMRALRCLLPREARLLGLRAAS